MKRLFYIIALVFGSLLFAGCHDDLVPFDDPKNKTEQDINVLVIGNSYGPDAFSYVPFIIENVCPNVSVKLWILFIGNCNVNKHRNYLENDEALYQLFFYNTGGNDWKNQNYLTSRECITAFDWDLIVTHQISNASGNYNALIGDLEPFVNEIRELSDAPIAWLQVPTLPTTSTHYYERLYEDIVQTCRLVVKNTAIDYVIPCGTAIESAKHTDMNELGDFGQLSADGVHLQEGIPCLLEAYTSAQFIINMAGLDASVMDCTIEVTNKWLDNKGIPRRNGSVVGTDDPNNYVRAKQMALNAVSNPYKIEPVD